MFGQGFNSGFFGDPPCFTDTTDIFKDRSGVALYTLDYDASDSGNATGKFGEAAIFNGSSSKIELPSALSNGSTTATGCISFWFNVEAEVTSSTPSNEIMQFAGTSSLTGKIALGSTSGHMSGETFSVTHNVSGVYTYSTTNIPGGWNHAVVQWNSSDGKWDIYINSVKHTTYTVGTNAQGYFKLKFGNRSSNYYTGRLDQIRIYTSALTQSQITQLYQENNSTVGTHLFGCIANYNLDGSAKESMGTTAYDGTETDITYKYDGTPTAVDFGVGGKTLYGARFNGNTSVINTNYVLPADSTMSFSFWAKFDAVDNGSQRDFFGNVAVNGSGSNVNNRLVFRLRNDNNFSINIGNGSNYWSNNTVANATPYYNQWTFLCVTLNGTSVKVYINNSIVSLTSSVAFGTAGVLPLFIGEWGQGFGSKRYKGSIDQFRIFNKELSASEVSKLYGNGAGEIACKHTATTTDVAYPIVNSAYYKLDNNDKDSAKSTGKFNEGAIFSGNNGKITINNFPTLTQVGISMWVNIPDWSSQFCLISRYGLIGSTDDREFAIYTYQGSLYASTYYNGNNGNATIINTSSYFSNNTWHHVAFTSDGSTQPKLYIDGVQRGTAQSNNNSYYSSSQPVLIGAFSASSAYNLTGRIDQVRIYNTALSSTDVSNLYAETASNTSTLSFPSGKTAIVTYQLDGNSTDLSGNYNGTDTNITYAYNGTESNIEYRFGRYGQAAVFNGSSSQITTSYTTNDSAFTISGWIKHTSTTFTSKYHYLAAKGYYSSASNTNYWYLANYSNANPEFRVRLNSSDVAATSSVAMNLNQWHHLAATLDSSGNMKIYLDGILTGSTTGAPSRSMSQGINFGTFSGIYHHDGQIDQIRYYPSVLDADAIQNLYNEKPETDTSNFKAVLYNGTGGTQYISNVGMDLETSGGLVWIKKRSGGSTRDHMLYDSVRGAGNRIRANQTTAESNATDELTSFDANGFFLGSSDAVNGSSSSPKYVAWNWKGGGLLNKSASFNGSNSYIDLGTSIATSTRAVSMWVYAYDFSERWAFQQGYGQGVENYIRFYNTDDIQVRWGNVTQTFSGYSANTWYHIVAQKDSNNNANVWINGVEMGSTGTPSAIAVNQTQIGRRYNNNSYQYYFNGLIDQVRIFNTALSDANIATLYNETASTINTLQVLGDTSCIATYPLGVGAGDIGNTYSGTPSNVTFNNPGHLTRNTSGTIESMVSANQDAGFSIVKYTGNNTDGATVGTGLTQACNIVIVKDLTSSNYWCVGGSTVGNGENLYLNDSGAKLTRDRVKSVQTNTFTLGNHFETNSTNNFIAYCWHSVAGYSSIGTYSGGSTNTISTGFKPSWVMVKNTGSGYWNILDSRRGGDSNNNVIYANDSGAESTHSDRVITFQNNGFSWNATTSGNVNTSGNTYLYMAFK